MKTENGNTEATEGKGRIGGPEELNRVTERIIGAAMRVQQKSAVLERNAIEQLRDIRETQLLSYRRLASSPVGLLINFHVPHLREGIRRVINTRR